MHELPHELGDFIVYKKLGLSTRQALGLNLFAAMISFGGLYTGLALASDTDASQWLLALVAGLFIYIPMVDVVSFRRFSLVHHKFSFKLPEMRLVKSTKGKTYRFFLQNLGMLIGFAIMVLLSLFEDDIMNL